MRIHAGVAVPLAVVLSLLGVGLLIWRREYQIRHSSMRSALAGLTLRGSESIPSSSQDLKLELDGKGEPLLLGQGSFGRVRSTLACWSEDHSFTLHNSMLCAADDGKPGFKVIAVLVNRGLAPCIVREAGLHRLQSRFCMEVRSLVPRAGQTHKAAWLSEQCACFRLYFHVR